jgi:orotate phosphoribosyltransferase
MPSVEKTIAKSLLEIKAVKLSPKNPFTWASGWNSPIYCDNRVTLSHPTIRKQIYQSFAELIAEKYPEAELIAGVATGAIAHGVLVAEEMNKPFIYVRSAPKGHGLGNQIEGQYQKGQKVVVVEDLISTGGSSLSAVEALKQAEVEVLGMVAIFTYGFPKAEENFRNAQVALNTLSSYNALVEAALEIGYINIDELNDLKEWRKSPETWRK